MREQLKAEKARKARKASPSESEDDFPYLNSASGFASSANDDDDDDGVQFHSH